MTENTDAGESIVRVNMITPEAVAVKGSAYDARVATDTTPTLRNSAYDASVQVDTTPPARIEPVTTSAPDSGAAAAATSGE